jgi:hypothetical protein
MAVNTNRKKSCGSCGGQNLKCRRTNHPVVCDVKTIEVQRVSVRECMDCHDIKPTQAGDEKIARCLMTFMSIFDR